MKTNKSHFEIKEPLTEGQLHNIRKEIEEIDYEIEFYETNEQKHHVNLHLLYDRLQELEYILDRSLYLLRRKNLKVIK